MRTSSKEKKQTKLMRFFSTPIRTLTKAKNFYMRGLEDCAGKVARGGGGGGYSTASQVHLPRSFSVNSLRSNDDMDLRQLRRTVSAKKSNDAKKEDNRAAQRVDMRRRPMARQRSLSRGMGTRSFSLGMQMGRIDEDSASTFEEDDELDVKEDLYTRSRSYAV